MIGFYKQYFSLVFEICIAIFLIIYSYVVWENFDANEMNIARENIVNLERYANLK